jgi:hypothetical protein
MVYGSLWRLQDTLPFINVVPSNLSMMGERIACSHAYTRISRITPCSLVCSLASLDYCTPGRVICIPSPRSPHYLELHIIHVSSGKGFGVDLSS